MLGSAATAYRRIFTPPAVRFSLTGLVARLPISMVGLGIVLLAEHVTGSYAFAGSVSAVAVIANAVFAILQGRWIDTFGQSRVLAAAITVWGLGLAGTMVALESDWPHLAVYALAAVAGASLPAVGTCVRARWSHLLRDDPARLHTAYSFEAVADEVVFLVGPILVTMLATMVDPVAGLTTALVVGVLGTWAFSRLRDTEPPAHHSETAAGPRASMPWRALVPLTVASSALGVLFGAAEVTTVGFAEEHGHQAASGFLLATWSFGSLLAGVVVGAVTAKVTPLRRLRVGGAAMALAITPWAFVPNIPVMFVVLLVGGLAISPTLIAAFALAEHILPPSRLTEGMAFFQTGLGVGLAPGAAVAGLVIDEYGASPAYLVCLAGAVIALLASFAVRLPTPVSPAQPAGVSSAS